MPTLRALDYPVACRRTSTRRLAPGPHRISQRLRAIRPPRPHRTRTRPASDHVTDALPAAGEGSGPPGAGATATGRRPASVVVRSLFLLTKPRIIELLLVTTLPTMLLAARGLPSVRLMAVTLLGGALAAGSANTLNCYLDRDIDAVMQRTVAPPAGGQDRPRRPPRSSRARRWPRASCSGAVGHAAAGPAGQLAGRRAGRRRDLVLRLRLHAGAEAPDRVQHRDRRGGGLLPGAGRLGRGDRDG